MLDHTLREHLEILSRQLLVHDIRFNELEVRAESVGEGGLEPPVFRLEIKIADSPQGSDPDLLQASAALRVSLVVPEGFIAVEPIAFYQIPKEFSESLNPRALTAYMNEKGVFDLLPFAREALSDLSGRVFQNQILMPLFRRGDVEFELPSLNEVSGKNGAGY